MPGAPTGILESPAFAAVDEVLALARYPNVAVKPSALPCYSRKDGRQ